MSENKTKIPPASPISLLLSQLGFAFLHSLRLRHPPLPLSASPRSLAFQCLPNLSAKSKQCQAVPLSSKFGVRFSSYQFLPLFDYRAPPMAPSRRRGVSKAAAAAAACRQFQVGDLVLAKVKGFPAWPATVCAFFYFTNSCGSLCFSLDCAV